MKREERGEGLGEEEGEERGSRRWRDKGRKKRESRDREGRLRSGAQKIRKRADAPALHIPTRARAPSVWQVGHHLVHITSITCLSVSEMVF
jgi:hypothetical protein